MSNINKINSIPFLDVLTGLGYSQGRDYILQGDNIRMKDGGKVTDGWAGSIKKGLLKCHSGLKAGRIEGDRLNLVKMKFGFNDYEAFKWFEDKFNIQSEKMDRMENKMKDKWDLMPNVEQSTYLEGRGISVNKLQGVIKQGQYGVCLPIKSPSGNINAIQTRTDKEEHKDRYRIEKNEGGEASGLFFTPIPEGVKTVYVVEGMTDYLTLRQFTPNVVGIVSALTGAQDLKSLGNKYDLIYIPDADEAGEKSVSYLRDGGVNFRVADLKKFSDEIKDVNDMFIFIKQAGLSEDELFANIEEITERKLSNLELAFQDAEKMKEKGVIEFGDKVLDIMTGGLMRGSTMLINGPSGQGKTTLSLHMLRCLLSQKDLKIVYYSLETNVGRQIMKIISFLSGKKEKDIFYNLPKYKSWIDKLGTLELYDNIRDVDDIKQHITDNKVDIAFIDFAQKTRIKGVREETEKMIRYAQDMQDFAIDNGEVALISLSQTPMSNFNQVPILNRTPKNSGALFESSDTTMNVGRDENGKWVIGFMKTKNIEAEGWWTVCGTEYNSSTGQYNILPPDNLKSQDENEKSFDF